VEVSRTPKTFRWLKGSQELQSDEKYEMIQEGNMYVLLIRLAAYEDEAKYMFEAEDKRTTSKLVIQGKAGFIEESLSFIWDSRRPLTKCLQSQVFVWSS